MDLDAMRLELIYSEHAERVRAAERDYWLTRALATSADTPAWLTAIRRRWQALRPGRASIAAWSRGAR